MAASPSIRPQLERQMLQLRQDVLRMGALVEQSCWLAYQAFCDRDLAAAKSIKPHDREIDRLYRQIEQDCVSLLALHAPVAQDLRTVGAIMQLVRDLERIGDYAVDIGEVAVQLFPSAPDAHHDQLRLMMDRCRSMVAMSLAALSDLDADSALEIKQKDDLVDADYDRLYDLLVHPQTTLTPDLVERTVLLVLVIRYLERMADHATNIGRRVAYITTGRQH